MARVCTICGTQLNVLWSGVWQGEQANLCFECWDRVIGTGDEQPNEEDEQYEYDD